MAGVAVALSLVAAGWFTAGTPTGSAIGAVAACASYLAGRSARGLAGPQVGGWPSAPGERAIAQVSGIATEAVIVASLAAASSLGGGPSLWRLAVTTLVLLAVRHVADTCSNPEPAGQQREASIEGLIWRVLALPPGGQMLLVAVVTPVWGGQAALTGLACWATVALASMIVSRGAVPAEVRSIPVLRDDGPLASWLGRPVRGQLVPLPPALTGLAAVSVLAFLGLHDLPGLVLLAPVVAMLLAAVGSSHPHDGRLDWLVPALLQAGQYVYLAAIGFSGRVPVWLVFLLCTLVALNYGDLTGRGQSALSLGWAGRMLAVGLGAALGLATFSYALLAAYLGWLLIRELRTASRPGRRATAAGRPASSRPVEAEATA
jgi:hypothetical protein